MKHHHAEPLEDVSHYVGSIDDLRIREHEIGLGRLRQFEDPLHRAGERLGLHGLNHPRSRSQIAVTLIVNHRRDAEDEGHHHGQQRRVTHEGARYSIAC